MTFDKGSATVSLMINANDETSVPLRTSDAHQGRYFITVLTLYTFIIQIKKYFSETNDLFLIPVKIKNRLFLFRKITM